MKGGLIDIVSIQIRNYETYDTRAQQAHSLALLTRAIKTTQNCFVTKFNAKLNKILFSVLCLYLCLCTEVQTYCHGGFKISLLSLQKITLNMFPQETKYAQLTIQFY